ncbi:MAG: ASCH domain-containing protein [Thermodesulfobacteriota bacterium]|nr:ASCH domain-containing protein [Thermodesulfobacteriota bacterium]
MKALSIRQPWAWLIVNGYKDIENRSWKTKFRGRFLIHAGYTFDKKGYQIIKSKEIVNLPETDEFPRGGIVGSADLVDCVTASDSPWFEDKFGFVLQNAEPLPFVPLKGQLGFFYVDEFSAGGIRPESLQLFTGS